MNNFKEYDYVRDEYPKFVTGEEEKEDSLGWGDKFLLGSLITVAGVGLICYSAGVFEHKISRPKYRII